jgi:hypothetical protein
VRELNAWYCTIIILFSLESSFSVKCEIALKKHVNCETFFFSLRNVNQTPENKGVLLLLNSA